LSAENAALKAQLNIMKRSLTQPNFSHMLTSSPPTISVPSLVVPILSDGLGPYTTPPVVASASDGPSSQIIVAFARDAPVVACPKAPPSTILGVPSRTSTQLSDELKSGLKDKQLMVAVLATSGNTSFFLSLFDRLPSEDVKTLFTDWDVHFHSNYISDLSGDSCCDSFISNHSQCDFKRFESFLTELLSVLFSQANACDAALMSYENT
jgi:hypothetical protein